MSSEEIVLRSAEPEDAVALAEVNVRSWQAAFAGLLPDPFLAAMSVAEQAHRFERLLTSGPDVETWIAASDAGVLGYATLGPVREHDHPEGAEELYALYVTPSAWQRGIGRLLHARVLERFRERGVGSAILWVIEINERARAFYKAAGWTETGDRHELQLGGRDEHSLRYVRATLVDDRCTPRSSTSPR